MVTMDTRSNFVFALVISLWPCLSGVVSKACYGATRESCTEHTLRCSNGRIAIQEAFYMKNEACPYVGKICGNVSFSSMTLNGTRYNFNDTELDSLYEKCSTKCNCIFLPGRTVTNVEAAFSAIIYQCINATDICRVETVNGNNITLLWTKTKNTHTCSCKMSTDHHKGTVSLLDMRPKYNCSQLNITIVGENIPINCSRHSLYQMPIMSTKPIILHPVNVFHIMWIQIFGSVNGSCSTIMSAEGQSSITILPTPRANEGQGNGQSSITTTTLPRPSANEDGNEGAIAGGVTTVIIICIIVAGVIFWLKFIRKKKKDKKTENGNDNCAFAGLHSITDVQDRGNRRTTSSYDYTTIKEGTNPVGRAQNEYVLASKPSTENGTVLQEDDYNHINHNPPQSASSPGYDTTASAAAAVNKLKNASSNNIDDDDYNHLRNEKPSVVSSDYDTTVSASKTVAHLGEIKDIEDDYDHFKRSEDRVIDSPYDTANHHSIVSADTALSPYDLAH